MTRRRPPLPVWAIPLLLPVLPIRIARGIAEGTRDLARSIYKGTQKRLSRARRRRTNKRAATHDVATCNPMPEVTEQNQVQASILKLPLELRQQIYDLYFQQRTFFVQEVYDCGYKLYARAKLPYHIPYAGSEYPNAYLVRTLKGLLYLPLVCRQIYYESIGYLYQKSTFSFEDYNEASLLPSLAIFPQKPLDTLRSLEFRFCIDVLVKRLGLGKDPPGPYHERSDTPWTASLPGPSRERLRWAAFWAFLAALPNLQRLHVTFTRLPGPGSPADECVFWRMISPLLRFSKREPLSSFEVEWQRNTKDWFLPDRWKKAAPFQVVWIPGGIAARRY